MFAKRHLDQVVQKRPKSAYYNRYGNIFSVAHFPADHDRLEVMSRQRLSTFNTPTKYTGDEGRLLKKNLNGLDQQSYRRAHGIQVALPQR